MKVQSVLLVDDDPEFLNAVASGLRASYNVSAYLDYDSAFDEIIERTPDVGC